MKRRRLLRRGLRHSLRRERCRSNFLNQDRAALIGGLFVCDIGSTKSKSLPQSYTGQVLEFSWGSRRIVRIADASIFHGISTAGWIWFEGACAELRHGNVWWWNR